MTDPGGWGVYVHFPWCARVCPYCDFNVYRGVAPPHSAYADAVLSQWAVLRDQFPAEPPSSVFFGGGSPSLWAPDHVGRVLEGLSPGAGAEVTLEANPEDADSRRWRALVDQGVNRLSLGVQSFEADVLTRLGRAHSPDQGSQAVQIAQAAGFERVSLDLIYAVPEQRQWRSTLQRAVELGVGHVSAYSLTIEPGTKFAADGVRAAVDGDQLVMLRDALELLEGAGLDRYEVSNFARPGQQSRHNRLYWLGRPWLGLGAGGHSHVPREGGARRWATVRRPGDFLARAADGAQDWSEELDASDVLRERVMMGIRLVEGVTVQGERFDGVLDSLRREGLLEPDEGDDRVRATARGMEVLDAVIAALDTGLSG